MSLPSLLYSVTEGVLAGGLTLTGGVLTVLTAGAALPVLAAGAGLGLASGLTGASAALSKKILSSKQMSRVRLAIEVDSAATKQLETEGRIHLIIICYLMDESINLYPTHPQSL